MAGALLCVCSTLGAHPLLLNLPDAGESLWGNPAIVPSSIEPAPRAVDLPLGAVALLALADRSPLAALVSDDWSQIDLLKTLLQLRHPRMVVVGAPASPQTVEFRLTAGRVDVLTDGEQASLISPSRAWGPLHHPRMIPLAGTAGRYGALDVGVAFSTGLPRLAGDAAAAEALAEGAVGAQETYRVGVEVFGDLAVAARWRAGLERRTSDGGLLRTAFRLYTPLSLAHLRLAAGAEVATARDAVPSGVAYEWSADAWWPGTGVGGGLRIDAGVAYERGVFTYGLAATSLVNVFSGSGRSLADPDHPATVSYDAHLPVPVATVRYARRRPDQTGLSATGEVVYDGGLVVRAGARFATRRVSLLGALGWDRSVIGALGAGVRLGRVRVEAGGRLLPRVPGASPDAPPPVGVSARVSTVRRQP